MGQRANYAVVKDRGYRLYYSHWAANTIGRDLFWGPEHSLRFIQLQREVDPEDWLDEVWCEGGAVVDLERRALTLFGGEDLAYDIQQRRLYLRLLALAWPGWKIEWGYEGIASLADAAGFPRAKVLETPKSKWTSVLQGIHWDPLPAPLDQGCLYVVVTVKSGDGAIRIYPAGTVDHVLEDAKFLKQVLRTRPYDQLFVEKKIGIPEAGLHVDQPSQRIEFWTGKHQPNLPATLARTWRGWHTVWHHDRFEAQEEVADGKLRYPRDEESELLALLEAYLLHEPQPGGPVAQFESAMELLRNEGNEITGVNSLTSAHVECLPPRNERERIWNEVKLLLGSL